MALNQYSSINKLICLFTLFFLATLLTKNYAKDIGLITLGSSTDTVGLNRLLMPGDSGGSNGDWSDASTYQGWSVRYPGVGNNPLFSMTVPPSGGTLKITCFSETTDDLRIWVNFRDGGTWEDMRLKRLDFTRESTWITYLVQVPQEVYLQASTLYASGNTAVDIDGNLSDGLQLRFQIGGIQPSFTNTAHVAIHQISMDDNKIWNFIVGTAGDTYTTSACPYLVSTTNWSSATTLWGRPVRYTLGTGTPDAVILPMDSDNSTLSVTVYDNNPGNAPGIALWADYGNGGSWQDQFIGNIPLTGSGGWKTFLFYVDSSTLVANAVDQRSGGFATDGLPGSQIMFRFWNMDSTILTRNVAINQMVVSNLPMDQRRPLFNGTQEIQAIKFDACCSPGAWGGVLNVNMLVPWWKQNGFNAIFTFPEDRNGAYYFNWTEAPSLYTFASSVYAGDLMRDLMSVATVNGMEIAAGVWSGRDDAVYAANSSWECNNGNGPESESLISANSPYFDVYIVPMFKRLHDVYGFRTFFMQEFWEGWSAVSPGRSDFNDYSINKFNVDYGYNYTRSSLISAIGSNTAVALQWYRFQYDSMLNVMQKINDACDGGITIVWHNVSGIDGYWSNSYFSFITTSATYDAPLVDYIGAMILYPDILIFSGKYSSSSTPNGYNFDLYDAHRLAYLMSMTAPLDRLFMETQGGGEYDRPNVRNEIGDIYLAEFATGVKNWVYEQDAIAGWDTTGLTWSGLQDFNYYWAYLMHNAIPLGSGSQSFVTYTDTTVQKAYVWYLQNVWNLSTVKSALLVNLSNNPETFTINPDLGTSLYDIKTRTLFSNPTVQVAPQSVSWVATLGSGYDITLPSVTSVQYLSPTSYRVGFTKSTNGLLGSDTTLNLVDIGGYLRTLNIGSTGDMSYGNGMDDVDVSTWGPATTVYGRTARYPTGNGTTAPLLLFTLDSTKNYTLAVTYYDGGTGMVDFVIDDWNGGSWADYDLGFLRLNNTQGWVTQYFEIDSTPISQASDAGIHVPIRFWQHELTWLTQLFQ